MVAHASLIETSEEDALVECAKYIGGLQEGAQVGQRDVQGPMRGARGAIVAPNSPMPPSPAPQEAFAAECEALYAAEQHEKLLDKFISSLDVLLASSSSDAGAPPPPPPARPS